VAHLLKDKAQMILVHEVVVHLHHQRAGVDGLLALALLAILRLSRHAKLLEELHLHLGLLQECGAIADDLDGVHLVAARLHL
tara:strand:+ start:1246 stop:1491 length:246 start_codon:yes stop_codon:yes gene_type:complete